MMGENVIYNDIGMFVQLSWRAMIIVKHMLGAWIIVIGKKFLFDLLDELVLGHNG